MTNSARRYLTFGLRSLFVVITALAVWLGVIANRAREQREAVKAIEALGGSVFYDWQELTPTFDGVMGGEPPGPAWLRRIIGDDIFQSAQVVTSPRTLDAIPHLQKLRELKTVVLWEPYPDEMPDKLQAALPDCEVMTFVTLEQTIYLNFERPMFSDTSLIQGP